MKNGYRFILFFILGWIISTIISCTNAPIHKQTIRHGVIDYHELIEPLGTKHLYKIKPIVGKSYYCLIHNTGEFIWMDRGVKKIRRYTGPEWR